jgi:hypothetical protein
MSINLKKNRAPIIAFIVLVIVTIAFISMSKFSTKAWTGPGTYSIVNGVPSGNVPAPLNSGTANQSMMGKLGIGTASPLTKLHTEGSQIASFTGTTRGILSLSGPYIAGYYAPIDFLYNTESNPTARIAAYSDGTGSKLMFGTSANYASGITNTAITINNKGNVGIGTTTPSNALTVISNWNTYTYPEAFSITGTYPSIAFRSTNANATTWLNHVADNRTLYWYNDPLTNNTNNWTDKMHLDTSGNLTIAGLFSPASDIRLKNNIVNLSGSDALLKVDQLQGVSFTWKGSGLKSLGFIAQDVEKILPELVSTDSAGMKSMNYDGVIPVLVEAIKNQQSQINELKKEIEILKSR